jgi:Protein of unknown function (DUF3443)
VVNQRTLVRSAGCITIGALVLLSVACGGSSNSSNQSTTTTTSGNNVQSIAVNGGPVAGQIYPDAAFTSVTLCVPGTSTCQTVDGILVDTGSSGLRVLASALTGTFPNVTISGDNAYDCVNFIDGSFLWGPMEQADIEMGGEKASSASFQLIENPTFTIPSSCSNGGVNEDTQSALGANGILGVGQEPTDCYIDGVSPCLSTVSTSPPPVYYTCGTSGNCQASFVPVAQQVINPIIGFSTDNNGVIVELPSVNDAAASVTGSMIFGIGTQSNNALGSATVFTVDPTDDDITTNFNSVSLTGSFIDSGSNGLFFQDAIPQCSQDSGFYCPGSTLNLSAQNVGANKAQNTVNFSVDSAIQNDSGDSAFSNLAGPIATGTCTPTNLNACTFDWGLPFFFNRNVYVSIDGQTVPSGSPAAPWWAY